MKETNYSLVEGFTYIYESVCKKCGEVNTISIKWDGNVFEVNQEGEMKNYRILLPVLNQVENLPMKAGKVNETD